MGSPSVSKSYGVVFYDRLLEHLCFAGTSAPTFLDQAHGLLERASARDPEEADALERARQLCSELLSKVHRDPPRGMSPGDSLWLAGHSPVSGGAGQFERQIRIMAAVPEPPSAIALHFRVRSYKRGQYFDMESLGYVVLATWRHDLVAPGPVKVEGFYRPTSIWLTMAQVPQELQGLELVHRAPPSPEPEEVELDITIHHPPKISVRGTVIAELADLSVLAAEKWLGLEVVFPEEVDIGEFGFVGPIKPLIDAMSPILGRDSRGGPADHRLHDLRIRHGDPPDGSVRARFWYCADEASSHPFEANVGGSVPNADGSAD